MNLGKCKEYSPSTVKILIFSSCMFELHKDIGSAIYTAIQYRIKKHMLSIFQFKVK